ncbi:MAG: 2-oxoacid:acceptor oxidoreductase subunit alpha [Methanosarcinaceae archaeon]|nr:2-oxoacid:acceptor oxidoreductase subunit alpha [Methanosarcinaceae archaeon]
MDYTLRIGGKAGQGLQTIGGALAKVFSRKAYHVFTHQDYMSRVRGGHNYYQVRISDRKVTASREKVDVLVALDLESIERHRASLGEMGLVLYDSESLKKSFEGPEFLDVPLTKIALESGKQRVMTNSVALGAVHGVLGVEPDTLGEILKEAFAKKGEGIIEKNLACVRAGYDYVREHCKRCEAFELSVPGEKGFMLINGLQAIGLGALLSGCKFYSAYPMTPSTGIMNFLASKAEQYGIIVEQAEDELAAINMALGASFAGVRAMTGTSGGGFALMNEGLSLAAMTETPLVLAEVQRPGPATGLPTRTEQADLLFVLHAGHGEFPRVIYAPGTPKQAFYLTNKAFELAEKYQVPVFILADQYLGDTQWTYGGFDTVKLIYNDYRLRDKDLEGVLEYKRHTFTGSGISPLAVPGECGRHLVVTDSDEHDEEGHIIEDAETRVLMMQKRLLKKLPLLRREMEGPLYYGIGCSENPGGSELPEILLAGFGSTYGVMKEVVDMLSKDRKIAMLHFSEIYPLPEPEGFDFLAILKNAGLAICVENNATGQFAKLLRAETGFEFTCQINRYDGRPFTAEKLVEEIHALL